MADPLEAMWARIALAQALREHAEGQLSDEALRAYVERLEQAESG